ncbi:hypothetical protein HGG76_25665 [Ochrobactrum tritici]|uniref:Uncharacterized protein n=1 Tax=Brucella tritici TaxID=94626 RepID=A0A7X6FSD1_9HYPH|nr:hypothetical protein [Brucella tritici]
MTRARKIQAATQIVVANNARAANRANQAAAPTSTTNLTFSGNQLIVDGQAGNIDDALATENVARSFSLPDQPRSTIRPLEEDHNKSIFAYVLQK